MATRNPFSNLTIRRDEDDEDTTTRAQAVPASTGALFSTAQAGEQKKKKKVRPEEKKKMEETHQDDEEGFEIVMKKGPTKPKAAVTEEEPTKRGHEAPKKFKKLAHGVVKDNEFNTEKRLYERHSGTGRGKEISKGGAGGKHTWGNNPKNIARDQDYNRDEQSLNPDAQPRRQREERHERQEVVVEKVEAVVEKVVEKVEEKPAEEKPVEETPAEGDFKNLRKKKKAGEEVKQEELLERPENALSLTEYLEQLKLKNQAISQPKRAEVVAHHANSDLQANASNDNADEIGIAAAAKKQRKNKEKKTDTKELNFVAQTEASTTEKKYEQKGNKKSHGNGAKLHFNDEEFPEL